MGRFAPPPPPGARRRRSGEARTTCASCSAIASSSTRSSATNLEIDAFEQPHEYGEHFKDRYGPTIIAQATPRRTDATTEFDEVVNNFCDEWNRGTEDDAHFEQEYLVAVGKRA